MNRSRHAFTLLELLAVIALAALALTLATVTQQRDRAAAWKQLDIQHLGAIQSASAAFTLTHEEKLPSVLPGGRQAASFYPPDARYTPAPDVWISPADDDMHASAKWTINAIRRLGGRSPTEVRVPAYAVSGISFSHLAIADFLAIRLPSPQFVSAADRFRLRWHDIEAFDAGAFDGYHPGGDWPERWPYSSSFQMVPAAWSPDRSPNGSDGVIRQAYDHATFSIGGRIAIGLRRLTKVAFPEKKICWFDSVGRYSGRRDWFYAHAECEGLSSTFDGAVRQLATGVPTASNVPPYPGLTWTGRKLNPGWDPLLPNSAFATSFSYEPQLWEPPKRDGTYGNRSATETLKGFERYCRRGLAGFDFGGQEVR